MQADTLLADKAFDADERVIEPLLAAEKSSSFRPRVIERFNASTTRNCFKGPRHLMENFYCKLKQYRAIARPATIRPPETSSAPSIWPPQSFGSIEDRL